MSEDQRSVKSRTPTSVAGSAASPKPSNAASPKPSNNASPRASNADPADVGDQQAVNDTVAGDVASGESQCANCDVCPCLQK